MKASGVLRRSLATGTHPRPRKGETVPIHSAPFGDRARLWPPIPPYLTDVSDLTPKPKPSPANPVALDPIFSFVTQPWWFLLALAALAAVHR